MHYRQSMIHNAADKKKVWPEETPSNLKERDENFKYVDLKQKFKKIKFILNYSSQFFDMPKNTSYHEDEAHNEAQPLSGFLH